MAEEIIASWDDIGALVAELVTSVDGERKTRMSFLEITAPLKMNFRLQDGNGNPVNWPIVLISDTTESPLTLT